MYLIFRFKKIKILSFWFSEIRNIINKITKILCIYLLFIVHLITLLLLEEITSLLTKHLYPLMYLFSLFLFIFSASNQPSGRTYVAMFTTLLTYSLKHSLWTVQTHSLPESSIHQATNLHESSKSNLLEYLGLNKSLNVKYITKKSLE